MITQKTLCIAGLLVLSGILVLSQQTSQKAISVEKNQSVKGDDARKERARREIETLISYALASQSEFASDVLIRLVESNKIADTKQKIELLEQAFLLASRVQFPYKKVALPGSASDVRSGYLANAFHFLNMDKLSLQCRSVKATLPLDAQKAKDFFNEINKPKLVPLTCEDSLVYDVSVYYKTATSIAQSTFNDKEIRRGDNIRFVQQLIEGMTSPTQIQPILEMILSIKVSPEQFSILISSFSRTLDKVSGDDRSFSVPWGLNPSAIENVVIACKKYKTSSSEILRAYRDYLVRHLGASRCADSMNISNVKSLESNSVKYFNEKLRLATFSEEKDFPLITDDEIKPRNLEETAKYQPYWTTPKAKRLLTRIQQLNFKNDGKRYSSEEKLETEWQQKLSELLAELVNWESKDEKTEEDYFHQKSVLLFSLVDLAPMGIVREKILAEFIAFVSNSSVQKSSPIEWFVHADRLIRLARSQGGEEGKRLIEVLKNTSNPTLYMYAELERSLPLAKR